MDVKGIVLKYLKDNGFDGLYDTDICGCFLDDLMPCDCPHYSCEPGYRVWLKDEESTGIGSKGGWEMNRDEIREGDNVNVYFENVPWLKHLRVNHIPCATGDCWHLENTETRQIYHVMFFAYMELVKQAGCVEDESG